MDLTNDYHEEAARERLRAQLVEGYRDSERAMAVFRAAKAAERDEISKEKLRRQAHESKLKELQKASFAAHTAAEHASECEQRLMAEFVPLDLRKARDMASSRAALAGRALESAEGDVRTLRDVLARRDPKKIRGALLDKDGSPRREPSKPGDPSAHGKVIMGDVPNPNRWAAPAERVAFMARLDAAVLAAEEARIKADQAQAIYNKAEAAVSECFEAALNGR